jgi:DNA-binding CsgD family transcriptional regulator
MTKPAQALTDPLLPATKVRELLQYVGETLEVARSGEDALVHASECVLRLAGGEVGALAPLPAVMSPRPKVSLVYSSGWPDWIRGEMDASFQVNGTHGDPAAATVLQGAQSQHIMIGTRRELVDDQTWGRSPMADQFHSGWRLGDAIYGGIRAADAATTGMVLFRTLGARPYSDRDRALVQLFVERCAQLFVRRDDAPHLSPRERQVLAHLLDGRMPKQIASELGLSVNTVNQYVRGVYRAHGVTTRAELLARFLRRRRRA